MGNQCALRKPKQLTAQPVSSVDLNLRTSPATNDREYQLQSKQEGKKKERSIMHRKWLLQIRSKKNEITGNPKRVKNGPQWIRMRTKEGRARPWMVVSFAETPGNLRNVYEEPYYKK